MIETKRIKTGMRGVFKAPPGYNIVVCDYSSQELRCAAALSGDKEMLSSYFLEKTEPYLIRSDTGEQYENPKSDLHLVSAEGIFPELLNYPLWERLKISKTLELNGNNYRALGKTLNFTVIFGGAASRISEVTLCDKDKSQLILDSYFAKFWGLKRWLDRVGQEAKYQKWVRDAVGRVYMVGESNAKGTDDENSHIRKGANSSIQGLAASISKKAGRNIVKEFDKLNTYYSSRITGFKEAELVGLIHDEALCYVPGTRRIIDMPLNPKTGCYEPVFKVDDISTEYAELVQKCMESAMDEIINPLLNGMSISKAETGIGSAWSCK